MLAWILHRRLSGAVKQQDDADVAEVSATSDASGLMEWAGQTQQKAEATFDIDLEDKVMTAWAETSRAVGKTEDCAVVAELLHSE